MPKFEKEFVHFMWDDELEGKTVFFADYIPNLQRKVENNAIEHYTKVTRSDDLLPFRMNDGLSSWQFVYFDPHYELKLAHEQGKKIECKRKGDAWGDLDWDYTPSPEWLDDHEYRIMQEEENPVTNRELARWLAQGRGECRLCSIGDVSPYAQMAFRYCDKDGFLPVKGIVLVRKWDDNEWHKPTREYMGLEE